MLRIFRVPAGHLYLFFQKMSIQVFCPFLTGCSSSRQQRPHALVNREQGARTRLFCRNSTARSLPTGFSTDLASEHPPQLHPPRAVSFPLCPAVAASWAKPRSGSTQLFTFSTSISQLLKHGWKNLTPCRWCLYKLWS